MVIRIAFQVRIGFGKSGLEKTENDEIDKWDEIRS